MRDQLKKVALFKALPQTDLWEELQKRQIVSQEVKVQPTMNPVELRASGLLVHVATYEQQLEPSASLFALPMFRKS